MSAANADSIVFFGRNRQLIFRENLLLRFELYHGDTAFKPPDWLLTITPDPAKATSSQTTVRVDLSSGQPRVQELLVRSGNDKGLATADLPAIDLGMLIRALSGGPGASALTTAASTPDTTSDVSGGRRNGRKTTKKAAPATKKTAAKKTAAKKTTKAAKKTSAAASKKKSAATKR